MNRKFLVTHRQLLEARLCIGNPAELEFARRIGVEHDLCVKADAGHHGKQFFDSGVIFENYAGQAHIHRVGDALKRPLHLGAHVFERNAKVASQNIAGADRNDTHGHGRLV